MKKYYLILFVLIILLASKYEYPSGKCIVNGGLYQRYKRQENTLVMVFPGLTFKFKSDNLDEMFFIGKACRGYVWKYSHGETGITGKSIQDPIKYMFHYDIGRLRINPIVDLLAWTPHV